MMPPAASNHVPPARTCQRCNSQVQPGAAFCTACGSPMAGRATVYDGAPQQPAAANSGIIGVSTDASGASHRPPGQQQGSDDPVPAPLSLVNASVGKRLGAKLLDAVPPLIVSSIGTLLAFGQLTGTATTPSQMLEELASMALFSTIASLLCLAYWIWQWGWAATRGNTIGNAILGVRTTNLEGFRAGWGSIFVRALIVALGSLVLLVGAIIVLISNVWDKNGRKQGWHDKAAKTYVFDIRAGRNPLQTGGISGPESFAPTPPPPPLQRVASPMAGGHGSAPEAPQPSKAARQPPNAAPQQGLAPKEPHEQTTGPGPDAPPTTQPLSSSVISSVPGFAPAPGEAGDNADRDSGTGGDERASQPYAGAAGPAPAAGPERADPAPAAHPTPADPAQAGPPQAGPAQAGPPQAGPAQADPVPAAPPPVHPVPAAHPDDDVEATRITRRAAKPQVRLAFDDGREVELRSAALIGRNPAGRREEAVDQLIDVPDQGRSVSKTHLHLRVEASAVWVTDRNSTNGSAISTPDGTRTELRPGEAIRADAGSTVHFGDRSFLVGTA